MFIIVVVVVSCCIGIVMVSGASFAMRYYRGRFGQGEKRSAMVIGVASALLFPTMYCAQFLLPGKLGEIVSTALIIAICATLCGARLACARSARNESLIGTSSRMDSICMRFLPMNICTADR